MVGIAAALLALVAVEGLFRIWLRVSGEPYSAAAAEESMRQIVDVLTEGIPTLRDGAASAPDAAANGRAAIATPVDVLHPYFGIDFKGRLTDLPKETAYFQSEEAARNFDVVILGGSVAAIFADVSADLLRLILASDPSFANREIRIHNQARGGFKQPQQVNVLAYLLTEGWHPDAVVNIDGFNEVALSLENAKQGANPNYPIFAEWAPFVARGPATGETDARLAAAAARRERARSILDRALRWHFQWSAVLGTITLSRLTSLYNERAADTQAQLRSLEGGLGDLATHGPPFDADPDKLLSGAVRAWTEGSRSLHALCAARSILYLHVLQPTLHDAGAKPLTPREIQAGRAPETYVEGARRGYPLLREEGDRLRSEGIAFFDGSRLFKDVREDLFVDSCHFDRRGNRILGEAVARELLALTKTAKR